MKPVSTVKFQQIYSFIHILTTLVVFVPVLYFSGCSERDVQTIYSRLSILTIWNIIIIALRYSLFSSKLLPAVRCTYVLTELLVTHFSLPFDPILRHSTFTTVAYLLVRFLSFSLSYLRYYFFKIILNLLCTFFLLHSLIFFSPNCSQNQVFIVVGRTNCSSL